MSAAWLPNLLVLGPEKAGTTWLYEIFRRQENIFTTKRKELFFFNKHWRKGLSWYEAHFAGAAAYPVRCEITPSYFRNRDALRRIGEVVGQQARFIICLRHPLERAFSHYVHDLRRHWGRERPFRGKSFFTLARARHEYHFTRYFDLVAEIFERFGPERVLVLNFERDILAGRELFKKLEGFLSVALQPGDGLRQAANPGCFPRVLYGGERGVGLDIDQDHFEIPPHELVLCDGSSNGHSWPECPLELAQELLSACSTWTSYVSARSYAAIWQTLFAKDVERLDSLLGTSAGWNEDGELSYALAGIPGRYKAPLTL